MTKYELLLDEAAASGLLVKEKPLKSSMGRIDDKKIAISKELESTAERTCVLAEELGHYYTSHGNILDQSIVENRKQERRARAWGYYKILPPVRFIDAYKHRCLDLHEMSEFFDVSYNFLEEAILYYKVKFGNYIQIDRYMITFEPFGIFESFN